MTKCIKQEIAAASEQGNIHRVKTSVNPNWCATGVFFVLTVIALCVS